MFFSFANSCSASSSTPPTKIDQPILRFDLLIEGAVLVEAKSVEKILPIHKAQLLSYMKLLDIPIGLLINFNTTKLINGVHRLTLPGADR